MEVWFSIVRNRGREANTRAEDRKKNLHRAPPERLRRAVSLLTKTYHGSRVIGNQGSGTPVRSPNEGALRRGVNLDESFLIPKMGISVVIYWYILHLCIDTYLLEK